MGIDKRIKVGCAVTVIDTGIIHRVDSISSPATAGGTSHDGRRTVRCTRFTQDGSSCAEYFPACQVLFIHPSYEQVMGASNGCDAVDEHKPDNDADNDSSESPAICQVGDIAATGLTTKQHAAILLRAPVSGSPWLDEMIVQANAYWNACRDVERDEGRATASPASEPKTPHRFQPGERFVVNDTCKASRMIGNKAEPLSGSTGRFLRYDVGPWVLVEIDDDDRMWPLQITSIDPIDLRA